MRTVRPVFFEKMVYQFVTAMYTMQWMNSQASFADGQRPNTVELNFDLVTCLTAPMAESVTRVSWLSTTERGVIPLFGTHTRTWAASATHISTVRIVSI